MQAMRCSERRRLRVTNCGDRSVCVRARAKREVKRASERARELASERWLTCTCDIAIGSATMATAKLCLCKLCSQQTELVGGGQTILLSCARETSLLDWTVCVCLCNATGERSSPRIRLLAYLSRVGLRPSSPRLVAFVEVPNLVGAVASRAHSRFAERVRRTP